jgi:hypothetical protein
MLANWMPIWRAGKTTPPAIQLSWLQDAKSATICAPKLPG